MMNQSRIKKQFSLLIACLAVSVMVFAGNKDRSGQAGAGELLINPWARSGGLFGLNAANVKGLEAMKVNIAGLASLRGSELGLAHTRYLAGSGINVSNAGFAHKVGESASFGVNLMTFGFGDIPITTENSPEGNIGTYKPSFFNASIGFAKKFSQSMSAGLNVTFVNEGISNVRASAIGFDGGIQYETGKRDNFHIGITLRNIGTNLRFSGDGFSFNGISPDQTKEITVQKRSDKFQLPSQLNIGVSYDFYLDENGRNVDDQGNPTDDEYVPKHRLTPMFSFISNSFNNDWIGLGIEYGYKETLMLRAAYRYENDILSSTDNTTFYTGLAAGIGFMTDFGSKAGTKFAFDYSYKHTRISNGVHTLGLRVLLGQNEEEEE